MLTTFFDRATSGTFLWTLVAHLQSAWGSADSLAVAKHGVLTAGDLLHDRQTPGLTTRPVDRG